MWYVPFNGFDICISERVKMKMNAARSRTAASALLKLNLSLRLKAGDSCPRCGSLLIEEPKQLGFENDWEAIVGRLRCIPCGTYYGGIIVRGVK